MLESSRKSSPNGHRKRSQPMLLFSSIEPAPVDDGEVDGVAPSCGDDFPTDFRLSSARSVRRRLSIHSDVTRSSLLHGLGERRQLVSVCSSIDPASTDDSVLDGVPTTSNDDFRSDFKFSCTRSVRRHLSARSNDIPQSGVVPAIGSSKKCTATLVDPGTLLSHQWRSSCSTDDAADASPSSLPSAPSNSDADMDLEKNALDGELPACNDDFPTSFASKANRPARRCLCAQPTSDCNDLPQSIGPPILRPCRKRTTDVLQGSTPADLPQLDGASSVQSCRKRKPSTPETSRRVTHRLSESSCSRDEQLPSIEPVLANGHRQDYFCDDTRLMRNTYYRMYYTF